MIRYIFTVLCTMMVAVAAYAQTPVEDVISKYSNVKGSRDFIASGAGMTLARSLIRRTPLACIAPEVEVLEVLKMQNASETDIKHFEEDLKAALKSYEYYGKADAPKGIVDVYIDQSTDGTVGELVIYNPAIYSVNSLRGELSADKLLQVYLNGL